MILRAKADFDLDLSRSVLIGDKDSDVEAGRAARVGYNVRLLRGLQEFARPSQLEFQSLAVVSDWLRQVLGETNAT